MCEEQRKTLPIGIEDFGKMINNGYYYVDKTLFIQELLDNLMEVNLFLRPRRFGKSLALSTLRHFFEDTFDEERNLQRRALFDGLRISGLSGKYAGWQASRPVISLSLSSMRQATFEDAFDMFKIDLAAEYRRLEGIALAAADHLETEGYARIMGGDASSAQYKGSLKTLSGLLHRSTGKKPIILIDEYDVPLDSAHVNGYYGEMIDFVRSLFGVALKGNESLEFAVMTGCLRVSQESIFTGLNNLRVVSMLHSRYGEYFGFTQPELDAMLEYYGVAQRGGDLQSWYNGYRIGGGRIYNPWSVLNCLDDITNDAGAPCRPYWANTSSNSIVKKLIANAGADDRGRLETLMSGGCIEMPLDEDVTYGDLSGPAKHLWGFMFFTGYLTHEPSRWGGNQELFSLRIPNREIMRIYETVVSSWFDECVKTRDMSGLYQALFGGDAEKLSEELSAMLFDTISYNDYAENFYHGFFTGMLQNLRGYAIKSNRESGMGRPDVALAPARMDQAYVVVEFKTADNWNGMKAACKAAADQISAMRYADEPAAMGYKKILCYGIAFWKKYALVQAL